ncbi:peptidoglycan DD-metalloendopeptidase family protein [Pedobacter nutrimenti]|uniref:peptidoglycan DD-metalloendopeptidase family protein n=1 Tax=Pedobacter nutrimenti TaxID=1241337 RepID=UPI0029312BDE|nr:peptidoglycan DD-metalloendopeptidase family protein [Pedobacter nutrimenti]
MTLSERFETYFERKDISITQVVDFDPEKDALYPFDFTKNNLELTDDVLRDTAKFSAWVAHKLQENQCRYGIGGYGEHRTIYARSAHFDTAEEPRRLHLGVDIWGPAGTPVYNFHEAVVHSFKFNDHFGDYGATIILKYDFEGLVVYGLYGHLSLASLKGLYEGQLIAAGTAFASFGIPEENGYWPPHLHFQLMFSMRGLKGDYPGVCKFSERAAYLANSPDPNLILRHSLCHSV